MSDLLESVPAAGYDNTKALGQAGLAAIAQQDALEKQALQTAIDNAAGQISTISDQATAAANKADKASEDVVAFAITVGNIQTALNTLNVAVNNINSSLTNISSTLNTIIGSDSGLSMRQVAEDVVNAS